MCSAIDPAREADESTEIYSSPSRVWFAGIAHVHRRLRTQFLYAALGRGSV